jgi:hypothetical protein
MNTNCSARRCFFDLIVWAYRGMVRVGKGTVRGSGAATLLVFLHSICAVHLTKPSGRFVLPGVCLGLVLTLGLASNEAGTLGGARSSRGRKHSPPARRKQAAWLLYVATFPLTSLDSPEARGIQGGIRDMVEPLRREIHTYYLRDDGPFAFLESPD